MNITSVLVERSVSTVETAEPDRHRSIERPAGATPRIQVESLDCFAVIGPPGIGKSTELHASARYARDAGFDVEFFQIGLVNSWQEIEERLRRYLSEADRQPVAVYFDALDEARVAPSTAKEWVVRASTLLAVREGTTKTRMSSRSSDWSPAFEQELRNIYGDRVEIFELLPLSRAEVAAYFQMAKAPSEVVGQVEGLGLMALAQRPVTLGMLLRVLEGRSSAELSKARLYRRSMLSLLEEPNRGRRAAGTVNIDPETKLAIASRLAAAAVLSNRQMFWDGLYSEAAPAGAVPLSEVCGGQEVVLGSGIRVGPNEIREVLNTALFRQGVDRTYVWAHQSFAEFLAANYLFQRAAPLGSNLALLSGGQGAERVVPQLWETAAWLSALDRSVFQELLKKEPEVLLGSDATQGFPDDRAVLVDALLRLLREGTDYDRPVWRERYASLAHPSLAPQLRPYLQDKAAPLVARRAAIDIAEACEVFELIEVLIGIALDPQDSTHIRGQSLAALSKLLHGSQRAKLLPALEQLEHDPDDEVRGWALRLLWPDHISDHEIFGYLTVPKNASYIGSYALFLYELAFARLSIAGAIAAIRWLEERSESDDHERHFDRIIPGILSAVWDQVEDSNVLEEFAEWILREARSHSTLKHYTKLESFEQRYLAGPMQRRRELIQAVFSKAPKDWPHGRVLAYSPWQLVGEKDLEWLVHDLKEPSHVGSDSWYIDLIVSQITFDNFARTQFVWDEAEEHLGLQTALQAVFVSDLESDHVKWLREDAAERKALRAEEAAPQRNRRDDIAEFLSAIERGDVDKFWLLNVALLQGERGAGDEFTGNLTGAAAWKELPRNEQQRVIQASVRYLREFDPTPLDFRAPNIHSRPGAAGYRSFRLLRDSNPEEYASLPASVWRKWIGPMLALSTNDGESEQDIHRQILAQAYAVAPDRFVAELEAILDANPGGWSQQLYVLRGWAPGDLYEHFWQRRDVLAGPAVTSLLNDLVDADFQPAVDWAMQQLGSAAVPGIDPATVTLNAREVIGRLILRHPHRTWEGLRRVVSANPAIARDLVLSISARGRGIGPDFSSSQMVDLYIWIERLVGPETPEEGRRSRVLGPADDARFIQSGIVQRFVQAGTEDAVAALQHIASELPEHAWLKWSISEARQAYAKNAWVPLEPRAVLEAVIGMSLEATSPATTAIASGPCLTTGAIDHTALPELVVALDTGVASTGLKTLLLVNDEWHSGHGGLSTFNRELAIALASAGHTVYCYLPAATPADVELASRVGVTVIRRDGYPGMRITELLAAWPTDVDIPKVDAVIGHDQVSGRFGLLIARERLHCKYVHVIHTAPDEIAAHKLEGRGDYLAGATKAALQRDLCLKADLVLAVGPKLAENVETQLSDAKAPPRVVEIVPGFPPDLLKHVPTPSSLKRSECLLSGRLDESQLKGADHFVKIATNVRSRTPATLEITRMEFVMRGFDEATMNTRVAELIKECNGAAGCVKVRPYSTLAADTEHDLKTASMFLMPSRTEGFGLAAFEALAAGVPILVSDQSGLGELLLREATELNGEDRETAEKCVLNCQLGDLPTIHTWADRAIDIAKNKADAFKRAGQLRTTLMKKYTWEMTARSISIALDELP